MANFKIPDWALPILEIVDEAELANFIEARIPNWFVDVIDNYSEDYPQFEENWQLMCKHLPDSPSMKKIILVEKIPLDKPLTRELKRTEDIHTASSVLTQKGYVVRRYEELVKCSVCKKALPSEKIYDHIKKCGETRIPGVWSNKCQEC